MPLDDPSRALPPSFLASRGFAARRSLTRVNNWREKRDGTQSSFLRRFIVLRIHEVNKSKKLNRSSRWFTKGYLPLLQEFVFFLLPLINIHKLKNLIVRRFSSPASLVKQPSIKVACHECGICNEPPTAPHQGQCGHVFCYYCIKVITSRPHFLCSTLLKTSV